MLPDSPTSEVPECPASFPSPSSPCNLRPPTRDALDDVDLFDELRRPLPTLQTVPVFVRAGARRALASSLQLSGQPTADRLMTASAHARGSWDPCHRCRGRPRSAWNRGTRRCASPKPNEA